MEKTLKNYSENNDYEVVYIDNIKHYEILSEKLKKFLAEEWPRVQATIQRLGLNAAELLNGKRAGEAKSSKRSDERSDKKEEH